MAGGLENELTVDHSGNAVVKTLTLSLDAREPHGREAPHRAKDKSVAKIHARLRYLTCPYRTSPWALCILRPVTGFILLEYCFGLREAGNQGQIPDPIRVKVDLNLKHR